jgi:polar amino acid transport system substrate-binding protein
MRWGTWAMALLASIFASAAAMADDAAKKDLAPTGTLRVGIAVAPTVGAGNVARGAAASLKATTIGHVKTADELFDLLKTGKADAIALSRESLLSLQAQLPGSRVLDGAYLNSYVAVAVPKQRTAGLAYASAFVDSAIASGSVRRALDNAGLKTSQIPPAGTKP